MRLGALATSANATSIQRLILDGLDVDSIDASGRYGLFDDALRTDYVSIVRIRKLTDQTKFIVLKIKPDASNVVTSGYAKFLASHVTNSGQTTIFSDGDHVVVVFVQPGDSGSSGSS